jgi:hypothetical protein
MWIETSSLSFTARHDSGQSDAALAVLDDLEAQRERLERVFGSAPGNVTVVLHDSMLQLVLSQPMVAVARTVTAREARRYVVSWFTAREVHTLAPEALRRRASGAGSARALALTPRRAYTLLVVASRTPTFPPPYRRASLGALARLAWVLEGAAAHFSRQVPQLGGALTRRLRGPEPALPPALDDAFLLGGTVYDMLERERGEEACVRLAGAAGDRSGNALVESAFGASVEEVRERWRAHLRALGGAARR